MQAALNPVIQKFADLVLNPLIKGMFAVALIVFLWGIVEFIRDADNDSARSKGKLHIFWGLVGMAIMVSVNSIIAIAVGTLESLAK